MKRVRLALLSKEIQDLLKRIGIEADRAGVRVYLVGGVVRDLLLGQSSSDIDVVVEGDGFSFARKLAGKLKAEAVFHERFRTAALTLTNGMVLDAVTARAETYAQPGALPDILPAGMKEDILRRDFTINALAVGLNADNFGVLRDDVQGEEDLGSKLIRVLHERSFIDDPTRILRAARYAVRFGFQLEALTQDLLSQALEQDVFKTLTPTRYFLELRRILDESDPVPVLDLLSAWNAVRYIRYRSPDRTRLVDAGQDAGWEVRFAALLKGTPQVRVDELCVLFNIPKSARQRISQVLQAA
jgi:tRNA nucleotidyltransferase (CCA-adding enzyme)